VLELSREQLIMEIDRLGPWLHDVEVAEGVRTGAAAGARDGDKAVRQSYSAHAMIAGLVHSLYGDSLEGRSFLDCACNAGGHAFAAAQLDAGRSLAFDARQHWLDQANFLARFLPAPDLEFRKCELADLPGLGLEPFDVTLFSGIFYLLPDPVAGLRIAADLTRELLVMNTSVLPARAKALILSKESPTVALSGVDGLAWLPTGPAVLAEILGWCGFPHVRIDLYWTPGIPKGWRRIQLLAAREEHVFERYDRLRPDAAFVDRPSLARRVVRRLRSFGKA
jgi:SAM-dependent methyltransferase